MAHVQKCKYCQKDVIDSRWHSLCRRGKLEDLLYRVQQQMKEGSVKGVSEMLGQEIIAETFCPEVETKRECQIREQRRLAKESWQRERQTALQQADAKFTAEHPDPDPPTC